MVICNPISPAVLSVIRHSVHGREILETMAFGALYTSWVHYGSTVSTLHLSLEWDFNM
jgi:hypothetical protein